MTHQSKVILNNVFCIDIVNGELCDCLELPQSCFCRLARTHGESALSGEIQIRATFLQSNGDGRAAAQLNQELLRAMVVARVANDLVAIDHTQVLIVDRHFQVAIVERSFAFVFVHFAVGVFDRN